MRSALRSVLGSVDVGAAAVPPPPPPPPLVVRLDLLRVTDLQAEAPVCSWLPRPPRPLRIVAPVHAAVVVVTRGEGMPELQHVSAARWARVRAAWRRRP